MPTYEIGCRQCGHEDTFIASMAECNNCPPCTKCGGETVREYRTAPMGYVEFPAAGGQGYVSTTSGKYIDTKKARIEDLKRSGCRPYEGFASESRQAQKDRAHEEKKSDEKLDASVREAYAQLTPEKKAALA